MLFVHAVRASGRRRGICGVTDGRPRGELQLQSHALRLQPCNPVPRDRAWRAVQRWALNAHKQPGRMLPTGTRRPRRLRAVRSTS